MKLFQSILYFFLIFYAFIQNKYEWLAKEAGPKMIKEALKLLDTKELSGTPNNPTIIGWAKEIGGNVADVYKADEIPWCGLFMAIITQRSGRATVKDPLWALNWGTFGKQVDTPMLGDVLVFIRKTNTGNKAGHVALYVGEDDTHYHILGGNQSDQVMYCAQGKKQIICISPSQLQCTTQKCKEN